MLSALMETLQCAGRRGVLVLAAALASLAGCNLLPGKAGSGHDDAPLFTKAQAERGAKIFEMRCTACHNLNAGHAQHPNTLAGEAFVRRWYSVSELYDKISLTMPGDKVFSLGPEQYRDVTAFLLANSGFKAGSTELSADHKAMQAMLLAPTLPALQPRPGKVSPDGYYSLAQAERGRLYFEGSCAVCHTAVPKPIDPGQKLDPLFTQVTIVETDGMRLGSMRILMGLAGPGLIEKWPSVGAYYKRIRATMPGHRPGALAQETYRDIVAYLLQANGLPAGPRDLPADTGQLDAMPILEPGFKLLSNGHDFSGMRFVIGNSCTPQPEGCGSTKPEPTFSIKNGVINTIGYPHGFMYTASKYLNFDLRFDYRMTPDPSLEPGDVYWGNSGYLLFVTEPVVWPRMLEIQAFDVIQLRPLPVGGTATYTYDEEAMLRSRRPIGEWSTVRLESKNGQVRCYHNGVLVSVITKHDFTEPGYIGFQSENANISWRNLRIKEY